jgi:hypothetical protein
MSDTRDIAHRDRDAYAAHDLIGSGWTPGEKDLAGAPVINDWVVAKYSADFVLCGTVTGHPTLKDGPITTSALVAIHVDGCWARTWGRWYALGTRRDLTLTADSEDEGMKP